MTTTPWHPSFIELDRAALGSPSPSLAQHLKTCAECGAYLERVTRPEPVPAWARALGTEPLRATRRLEWMRWGLPLLATAALGCLVLLFVPRTRGAEETEYQGPKGAPSVAVHIKRGDRVFLWDGRTPLAPEDRIRLQVSSGAHRYVTVAARAPEGPAGWTVLFEGPLSSERDTALPTSWRVDGAGGEETLRILFSGEPLSASQAEALFSEAPRTAKLWTTELRLPKSPPP
ncbi:hypothetical protein HRD49_09430 [Corallococcus exiguus]|uniref:hypothetical protein n=1 Tax=Corallococcus exiguus TaxID=83462 RepID=UPI0015611879|nr:hypothetical protein [Corallococcus exiguus]NRD61977.1 hypothetical protein [Corallococcus exiguus]